MIWLTNYDYFSPSLHPDTLSITLAHINNLHTQQPKRDRKQDWGARLKEKGNHDVGFTITCIVNSNKQLPFYVSTTPNAARLRLFLSCKFKSIVISRLCSINCFTSALTLLILTRTGSGSSLLCSPLVSRYLKVRNCLNWVGLGIATEVR